MNFNDEVTTHSIRGLTVEINGEVLAIAGVVQITPLYAFSEMKEEMNRYPVVIMKTAKRLKEIMNQYDHPIFAHTDDTYKNSDNFLERLGFKFAGKDENGRYYVWECSQVLHNP